MSKDQSKEPVLPSTKESSPTVEHVKVLLKRMSKTRGDFTPKEREEAEAHGFWVSQKREVAPMLTSRARANVAGWNQWARLPGALVQYGGTLRRVSKCVKAAVIPRYRRAAPCIFA
jgi:hypothetical protein